MKRIYTLLKSLFEIFLCKFGIHKWCREPFIHKWCREPFTGLGHMEIYCKYCGERHRFSFPPPPPPPIKYNSCFICNNNGCFEQRAKGTKCR